jgi:hypothetical protein
VEPLELATGLAATMAMGASDQAILPAAAGWIGPYSPAAVALLMAHLSPRSLRVDVSSPLAHDIVQPPAVGAAAAVAAADAAPVVVAGGAAAMPPHAAAPLALALTPSEAATVHRGTEKWFDVPFARVAADCAATAAWTLPPVIPGLALPPRNPFVPTDMAIKPLPSPATTAAAAAAAAAWPTGDELPDYVVAALSQAPAPPAQPAAAACGAAASSPASQPTPSSSSSSSSLLPSLAQLPHLLSIPTEVVTEALYAPAPLRPAGGGEPEEEPSARSPLLVARLWHKQDDVFRVPRTHVRALVYLPALHTPQPGDALAPLPPPPPPQVGAADGAHGGRDTSGDATGSSSSSSSGSAYFPGLSRRVVMAHLHTLAVCDDLTETLYQAELGKIDVSLKPAGARGEHGYAFSAYGFSHKLPLVLEALVQRLTAPSYAGARGVTAATAACGGSAAAAANDDADGSNDAGRCGRRRCSSKRAHGSSLPASALTATPACRCSCVLSMSMSKARAARDTASTRSASIWSTTAACSAGAQHREQRKGRSGPQSLNSRGETPVHGTCCHSPHVAHEMSASDGRKFMMHDVPGAELDRRQCADGACRNG